MASSREWYEIDGEDSFPNLEKATEAARLRAARSDNAVDIYRVTAVPVRCIKREVSLTETDIPEPLDA
ncbi:hypothetical protein [Streptomyces cinereoruber]|uniref:hypothetical protein n=1 Tax=Streptomyces cinereoruber TaxID=67260 RepID=UPI00364C63F4